MADVRGFLKRGRENPAYRPVGERLRDWRHVQQDFPREKTLEQAARCMDCGIPFCNDGCPLGNIIPDFNDLVFRDKWEDALARLHSTNNFPEFTGMVCPAPCEQACVLGINQDPVTIKQVEWEIVTRGWEEGFIRPVRPERRSGRSVAVIGSGPAGLAAAQQLARAGHAVTVFEKNDRVGGLLRYGIPDFKLEKWVIDRRVDQMREEGVVFQSAPARSSRATSRCRAASSTACTSRWSSCPSRTAGWRGTPSPTSRRSWQRTATWSSSAAATPARTASVRHIVRGRSRSRRSSCCRVRPRGVTAPSPGRFRRRCTSTSRAPTPRAASASTR
jgi:hypothetical protein